MGKWFGAFHLHYFPVFIVVLGIYAIRVLGGGEDWYDVWNEGEPYDWLTDFKDFFRRLGLFLTVGVGLGFLWVIVPISSNSFSPSYEESTPIKVASAKVVSASPAKQPKKHAKKKRATAKRHAAGQKQLTH